ncbi:MAG: hypothetical protein AB1529_01780 [Candidatus Micrarchaeota archaeon]
MDAENENGGTFIDYKVVASILLVPLLVMVYLSQAQGVQKQPDGEAVTKGGDAILADNKTGYEKTQEAILAAVPDGNYSDSVTYAFHSGNETVDISITVVNGTIMNASVRSDDPSNNVSAKIIGKFNDALPGLVVGKKIDELNIPKNVAGSSLTTAAFKQYAEGLVESYKG